MSYVCRRCGERHRGLPMSYGTDAPAYWDPSLAGDKSSTLGQEQCVIKDEHFFIRGRPRERVRLGCLGVTEP
jgi:hypothetical protein